MRSEGQEANHLQRRLAAILAADIAGYSSLMGTDEAATVRDLKAHQAAILPMIGDHGGRTIDTAGDGILAEFASVLNAVNCAVAIQKTMAERNTTVDPQRRMQFRIGINQGDVVCDETRIYGDGVNVAARIEALAEPGGICITGKVYEEVVGKIDLAWTLVGDQSLKNIVRSIRVYRAALDGGKPPQGTAKMPTVIAPRKLSILVMPVRNLSGIEQEYLAAGMTEELLISLAKHPLIDVMRYRPSNAEHSPNAVPPNAGANYVLEGSLRRSADKVRLTAQLDDTSNGASVWSERFENSLGEFFALQDDLTERIISAVFPKLRSSQDALSNRKLAHELDAYDFYWRARNFGHLGTEDGFSQGIQCLRQALAVAPNFPLAKATLAYLQTRVFSTMLRALQPHSLEEAKNLATEAINAESDNGEIMTLASFVFAFAGDRLEFSKSLISNAINCVPMTADYIAILGWAEIITGDIEKAGIHFERGIRLTPMDRSLANMQSGCGAAKFLLGNITEAIPYLLKATLSAPRYAVPWRWLAASFIDNGQLEDARAAVAQVLARDPHCTVALLANNMKAWQPPRALQFIDNLRKAGLPKY